MIAVCTSPPPTPAPAPIVFAPSPSGTPSCVASKSPSLPLQPPPECSVTAADGAADCEASSNNDPPARKPLIDLRLFDRRLVVGSSGCIVKRVSCCTTTTGMSPAATVGHLSFEEGDVEEEEEEEVVASPVGTACCSAVVVVAAALPSATASSAEGVGTTTAEGYCWCSCGCLRSTATERRLPERRGGGPSGSTRYSSSPSKPTTADGNSPGTVSTADIVIAGDDGGGGGGDVETIFFGAIDRRLPERRGGRPPESMRWSWSLPDPTPAEGNNSGSVSTAELVIAGDDGGSGGDVEAIFFAAIDLRLPERRGGRPSDSMTWSWSLPDPIPADGNRSVVIFSAGVVVAATGCGDGGGVGGVFFGAIDRRLPERRGGRPSGSTR